MLAGVRAALSERVDTERERAAFDTVLGSPAAIAALEAEADRDHLESIADTAMREDSPLRPKDADPAVVGAWLAKSAALLEFGGNNDRATELATEAVNRFRKLDDPRAIPARGFGSALVLKARGAYRNPNATRRDYEVSADDTQEAVEIYLAAGEADRAGHARRMNALIRSKLAKHAPDDSVVPQTVEAYEDLVDEAALIADRPDLRDEAMRAQYNVAAVAMAVARRSRDQAQAKDYLVKARASYRSVGDARRAHYGAGHGILVAPCDAGEAFTHYLEAQRFEVDPAVRQAHLARATELEVRALAARFKAEGRLGGGDTAKSSRQLTKIAHARELLNDSLIESRPRAFDEIYGDDAAVRRLTAENELDRFLADWLKHPSLRQVAGLEQTGDGDGPDHAGLVRALRDARSFDLTGLAGRRHSAAIGQTARTLGLVDDLMPTRRVYDAAIVLRGRATDDPVEAAFNRAVDDGELIATRVVVESAPPEGADKRQIETTLVDALIRLVGSDQPSTVLIVSSRLRRVRLLALGRATVPGLTIEGVGMRTKKETEAERLEELVQTATLFQRLLDADPDVGDPVAVTGA
ncbi:MAG: hypothetical protein ITG02_10860 [Patulibacter sp.]|nr:hypothetical protein [Patulibacter sp.]